MMHTALLVLILTLGGGAFHPGGLLNLAAAWAGNHLDPNGESATSDAGSIYDPDGVRTTTDAGNILDPDGLSGDAGNIYDPNG